MKIEYKGFDSTEMSLVIVKRFAPDSKFSLLLFNDTINLALKREQDINGITYFKWHEPNDSTNWSYYFRLSPNYEWEIDVPSVNRTDRIWDYSVNEDSQPTGGSGKASNACISGYQYTHNGNKVKIAIDGSDSGTGIYVYN
jgi:hypothetical protein